MIHSIIEAVGNHCHPLRLPSIQQTTAECRPAVTAVDAVILKFFIGINNSDIGFSLNSALNTGNTRLAAHRLTDCPTAQVRNTLLRSVENVINDLYKYTQWTIHPPICPSIQLSTHSSAHPPSHPIIYLFLYPLSNHILTHPSAHLPTHSPSHLTTQ